MGQVTTYFFDTYAFFEIIERNQNYLPYTKNINIMTTKWNLMELHYGLLLKWGKEKADFYYDRLLEFAVYIEDQNIKKANEMKFFFKKRNLSYIDCLGYTIAKARGIPFLTGDSQFKDLENVEFVR